jgi:hypothetical protein
LGGCRGGLGKLAVNCLQIADAEFLLDVFRAKGWIEDRVFHVSLFDALVYEIQQLVWVFGEGKKRIIGYSGFLDEHLFRDVRHIEQDFRIPRVV